MRPFRFLGSQVFLLAQPLLGGIIGDTAAEQIDTLLDNPGLLEEIGEHLEKDS